MRMAERPYDLVIIGAGAGGLIAADFAVRLGARTALVEKDRIGGDCTWTGCIPSKTLLKIAKVTHQVRAASRYGIASTAPQIDMAKVHDYVVSSVQQIYQGTTPEALRAKRIDVYLGAARFLDSSRIMAGDVALESKRFLIATGATPVIPDVSGLRGAPFVTYQQIFDVRELPDSMIVIGGGPVSTEIAQAYQRLGCQVTIFAEMLLPKEDEDVRELIERVFAQERVRRVKGRAKKVRTEGELVMVSDGQTDVRGRLLLVAAGRKPNIDGLGLDRAGVKYTDKGIPVDDELRTSIGHIYAAGDVLGGYEFSHFAGWQAFQAVRNALLPGSASGRSDLVPWVTFTDPEIARVGLGEAQARSQYGGDLKVGLWPIEKIDRAVCEDDRAGFIKILAKSDGSIVGASIVGERAGEAITEITVAIKHGLSVGDLAGTIHPYPTYCTGIQLLATQMAVEKRLSGTSGKIIRGLSAMAR
jgi:pyruvate/2-oxoglutarate dehydrogenase complex dihydrolipoamide dehydrogenase (E3) component